MNKYITTTLRTYEKDLGRSKTVLSSPSSLRSMDSGFSDSNESGSEIQPPPLLPRASPRTETPVDYSEQATHTTHILCEGASSKFTAVGRKTDNKHYPKPVAVNESYELCTSFNDCSSDIAPSIAAFATNLNCCVAVWEPIEQQRSKVRNKRLTKAQLQYANSSQTSARAKHVQAPPLPPRLNRYRNQEAAKSSVPKGNSRERHKSSDVPKSPGVVAALQSTVTVLNVLDKSQPSTVAIERSSRRRWLIETRWTEECEHSSLLYSTYLPTSPATEETSSSGVPTDGGASGGAPGGGMTDGVTTDGGLPSGVTPGVLIDSGITIGVTPSRMTVGVTPETGITKAATLSRTTVGEMPGLPRGVLTGAGSCAFTADFASSWSDSALTTPLNGHSKIRQLLSSQQHLNCRLQHVLRCIGEGRRSDALAKTEVLRQSLRALASVHAPITTFADRQLIADLDRRLINAGKHLAVPGFDRVDVEHLAQSLNHAAGSINRLISSLIETTAEILTHGVDSSYSEPNKCLKNILWLIRTDSDMIRLLIGRGLVSRLTQLLCLSSRDKKGRRGLLRLTLVTLAMLLSQAESIREMEKANTMDQIMLLLRHSAPPTYQHYPDSQHPNLNQPNSQHQHQQKTQPLTSSELVACLHVLCQSTRPRPGTIHRLQGIDAHLNQLIALLTVLFTTSGGDLQQLSVTILANLCLMNLELSDLILQHGVLPVLISSVLNHTIDLAIQLQISTVLAAMSSVDQCRQYLAGDSGRAVQALLLLLNTPCSSHSSVNPVIPPVKSAMNREPVLAVHSSKEFSDFSRKSTSGTDLLERRIKAEHLARDQRWSPPMRSRKHIRLASPPISVKTKATGDALNTTRDDSCHSFSHPHSSAPTTTTNIDRHHILRSRSIGNLSTSNSRAEVYDTTGNTINMSPNNNKTKNKGARSESCTCAVQHRAAVALCRLCSDKRVVKLLILPSGVNTAHCDRESVGGIATLVTRCRLKPHSDDARATILACLSALRRIASVCGMNVFSNADADELIRPPLIDSVLICTSREHYV